MAFGNIVQCSSCDVNAHHSMDGEIHNELRLTCWNLCGQPLEENKHCLYPYHFTKVKGLESGDHATRLDFCHWVLNSELTSTTFWKISYGQMSHFLLGKAYSTLIHIMYFWVDANPKAGREVSFQRRFNINVWVDVIGNLLLGPHVFQGTLNGEKYWNFLLGDLPRILHEEREGKESFTRRMVPWVTNH